MSVITKLGVARKSDARVGIVDAVMGSLCHEHTYRTLDYRRKSESYLKQYMHQPLQRTMSEVWRTLRPRLSDKAIRRKAGQSLFWEGDVNTTVNHVRFLGVQHRPDFVVKAGGIRLAVEIKRGENGSAVRDGIGQSFAYAACGDFDFVAYLFIDTSKDKKILESVERDDTTAAFIRSLWENYNIRFTVV